MAKHPLDPSDIPFQNADGSMNVTDIAGDDEVIAALMQAFGLTLEQAIARYAREKQQEQDNAATGT